MDIRPEDSISNVDSQRSVNSRSSRASSRSSASAKARAAARKAILEAEAAALERLQAIEAEELRLQQRKKHLELQTLIAKANAEEQAYAGAEEQNQFYVLDETPKDDVTSRDTPELSSFKEIPGPILNVQQTELANVSKQDHEQVGTANSQQFPNHTAHVQFPSSFDTQVNVTERNLERNYNQFSPIRSDNHVIENVLHAQERQNSAFQRLIEQQQQNMLALTLPQPDLPVFDGDPTRYHDFIRAFENLIERKTNSSSARLYYLVQYTSGQVKELVSSCLSMQDARGYDEARRLLLERYGQPYKIATAFVERLTKGPQIKAEDGPGLQRLSILLTSCKNTLTAIGYLNKLENPESMKKIIERLPFSLKQKWRETVDNIMQREKREASFKDIAAFVETRARVTTHPIFGNISNDARRTDLVNTKRQHHQHGKSYAVQGRHIPTADEASKGRKIVCPSCNSSHWLSQCEKFKKMSVDDRYKFVRSKKLCINCLTPGHYVRECPKTSFCRVQNCTTSHSTFLHPKESTRREQAEQSNERGSTSGNLDERDQESQVPNESNNGYVTAVSNFKANANVDEASVTGLAVVPVKVRAIGGNKLVKTYAFLDTGSNTTFCTEKLMKELGLEGKRSALSLTTLEAANILTDCSVVNLEIFDLDEEHSVELPKVFSRPSLPISRESISDQLDVNRWPHLQGINIPRINAEVGLLIGSDVPVVLQPREVRESRNGGPFATRTILGWVLNGPLGRKGNQISNANFVQANVQLNRQFEQFCNPFAE